MTALRAVRLVAAREAGDRLRNRAFVIGTLITLVVVVGAVVVPGLLADDGPPRYELGVLGDVPAGFHTAVAEAAAERDLQLELVDVADRPAARAAVEAGELDAVLLGADELMVDGGLAPAVLVRLIDGALQEVAIAQELARLGLPDTETGRILASHAPVAVVDAAGEAADGGPVGVGMAFAATILLFLAIQINGSSILTGSIEERSSRVVEVLLGTLRPRHLLAGKLVAMTALALGQVGLFVAGALVANAAVGLFEPPTATVATIVVSLVMVVTGFLFYAALYAVAGSMAGSVEEAQAAAGPLAFGVVGTYVLVVFAVIPSPDGTLAQVLTFLPPTAPFTVPARVALEAIPAWQVGVATLVTVLGAVATVRLGGRLYAATVLAGGRLTWRDAWRAEPIR